MKGRRSGRGDEEDGGDSGDGSECGGREGGGRHVQCLAATGSGWRCVITPRWARRTQLDDTSPPASTPPPRNGPGLRTPPASRSRPPPAQGWAGPVLVSSGV